MPKRFQFRLEKILELRKWEEKQAELALAAKTGECSALERQIQDLLFRKADAFFNRLTAAGNPTLMMAYEMFGHRLDHEVEENEKVLAKKIIERDTLQGIFLDAQKKRRVLDKLEEKRHILFQKEQDRQEALRLDDLNTAAFIRKIHTTEDYHG